MSGRYIGVNQSTCRECGDRIEVPGGWFTDFDSFQAHVQEVMSDHGLSEVDRHPSLMARLDQAQAEARDRGPAGEKPR
jgi:hypothetical protein